MLLTKSRSECLLRLICHRAPWKRRPSTTAAIVCFRCAPEAYLPDRVLQLAPIVVHRDAHSSMMHDEDQKDTASRNHPHIATGVLSGLFCDQTFTRKSSLATTQPFM